MFEQQNQQRPEQNQGRRADQHHPGMQGKLVPQAVFGKLRPDDETKAADNDEGHNHSQNNRRRGIAAEGDERLLKAERVHSAVAEGRNRKKDRQKNSPHSVFRHKDGRKNERPGQLKKQRGGYHHPYQQGDIFQAGAVDRLLRENAGPESEAPADHDVKKGGKGHETESADLQQQHDDKLSGR